MNSTPDTAGDLESSASQHSVGSQHSTSSGTTSLLERIRLQREREAAQQQQQTPQQIQVPNYGETTASGSGGSAAALDNNSSFFSSAWNNISQSMETGMAEHPDHDGDMEEALLMAPTSATDEQRGEQHYSMQNYFLTFVRDVYGLFLRMPVPVRIVAVIGLLYIAFKLM